MAGNPARVQDLHELARIWTRRGLRVLESPGWETYGRSSTITFDVLGVHHTGSGFDLDRLLWDGRPLEGIPGPLCNVALHARSALAGFVGEVVLMASGRANHFGVATWPSSQALGVEATGPPFANYPAYVQLAAGFCEWKGQDPDKVLLASTAIDVYLLAAHKEVAQPYGRKPDPSGTGWHEGGRTIAGVKLIDQFRTDVRAALGADPEEDDLTPEQASQLDQLTKDMAALKKEIVLTRPEGPTMDGTWYAWRRLNHGSEGTPPKTYSLAGLDARLARIEEQLNPAPPPSP